MGLWSTIKGWLNIGGVKVLLWKYTEPLSRSNPVMKGGVLIKSKSDKTVNAIEVKVIEEHTYSEEEDGEKKTRTDTKVLGAVQFPGPSDPGLGYPLEVKTGQDREQRFSFPVVVPERMRDKKGVLGGLGKLGAFASGDKIEYYLVAEASVKGAAFKTSDKQKLALGD